MKFSSLAALAAFAYCAAAQEKPAQEVEPGLDPDKPPKTEGAKIVKVKYGPFSVGARDMIENRPVLNAETPCDDCFITGLQAGLEYADGTTANTDTGAWLHHMVLSHNGGGSDPVCSIMPIQRIYASGNERSTARLDEFGKYGIQLGGSSGGGSGGGGLLGGLPGLGGGSSGGDSGGGGLLSGGGLFGGNLMGGLLGNGLGMIVDLMNMSDEDQEYTLTMTYEIVEGATAEGYKPVTAAWLDVTGNCGISYVPAREGQFTEKSRGWTSTVNGRLLFAYGHEHAGGTSTTIYKNGEPICVSDMQYGSVGGNSTDSGMEGMEGMEDGGDMAGMDMGGGGESLIGATACKDFGDVKVGDELVIEASYDSDQHALDKKMDGSGLEAVMGISRVYIGT